MILTRGVAANPRGVAANPGGHPSGIKGEWYVQNG